jgi:signal transduction histidine kinase
VIQRLVEEKVIVLVVKENERPPLDPAKIERSDAWIITTALWHERTGGQSKIANFETRARDLVDLVHSLGSARIAAVFAPVAAFMLAAYHGTIAFALEPILLFVFAALIAAFMFLTFQTGYRRTAYLAQTVIDQVLSDALVEERKKAAGPIETWPLLPKKRSPDPLVRNNS